MPDDLASPFDQEVVLATRQWLERAVIGLSLCPFAKSVHVKEQIRYVVSHAEGTEALLADLRQQLADLWAADPERVDTTLFIVPHTLADFLEYNRFMERAEEALESLGYGGALQLASFHPEYQFANSPSHDVANCTNRSPFPMVHLLRETSVSRAVAAFPEAKQIYRKNIKTLRALGHAGWLRVLAGEKP